MYRQKIYFLYVGIQTTAFLSTNVSVNTIYIFIKNKATRFGFVKGRSSGLTMANLL